MKLQAILIYQEIPEDSRPWGVGYLEQGKITHLSWYYKEDDARLAHSYLEHGHSTR